MTKSSNQYIYPISKNNLNKNRAQKKILWYLEQLFAGTHKGYLKHSIDFMEKRGTPVIASESGTVVFVYDDSKVGGPFKKYWDKGNRVIIQHKNNEFTAYEHFDYKKVKVKKGDKVKKGQVIGYVGSTGFGLFPHLHFELFVNPDKRKCEGKTINVSFTN